MQETYKANWQVVFSDGTEPPPPPPPQPKLVPGKGWVTKKDAKFCFYSEAKPKCRFENPYQRVACGFAGISKFDCEDQGCCYDEVYQDAHLCFHSVGF